MCSFENSGAMGDMQHFCLRWNNYQSSITSAFENLRDDEDFVDVTLACDGKSLKAHRVVLSACSPYFRELLKSTPCKHPVIVLQDVMFEDLHALVEFIYHGEVNVRQRSLSSFLKTAEVLRVSGLTQQSEAVSMGLDRGGGLADGRGSPYHPRKSVHKHRERPNSTNESMEHQDNAMPMKRPKTEPTNNHGERSPREDMEEPPMDFSTSGNNNTNLRDKHDVSPPAINSDIKPEPIELTPHIHNEREDSNDSGGEVMSEGGGVTISGGGSGGGGGGAPQGHTNMMQDHEDSIQSTHNYLDSKLFAGAGFNFSMAAALAADSLAGLNNQPHGLGSSDSLAGTSQQGLRKVFTCVACGKVLCSKASLKRHVADKHASRHEEYRCAICERVYCSRNSLMTHIYTYHKTQRPPPTDYYHHTPADVKF
ncbi:broad-complex core protein isoforms 1/2/3/4/5 isoform X4 [Cimex lectularius]|uniref:Broad n=1 Tax=Cimex lectularius TaxID=79782 RepID=A0A8I6RYV7_CIMLE|nr:broad-complex core protein isoforms 1/2/3/4/5 isoform X4 [Cimex lectularius]